MATIVISTAGTLGDHLPFIALAAELARRGHDIRLATNEAFHPHARALGLRPTPCGRPFGAEDARRVPHAFDHWRYVRDARTEDEEWAAVDLAGHFRDLEAAAHGADLLVASSLQGAAPMVHEATGIEWVTVCVMPWEVELIAAAHREAHPPAECESEDAFGWRFDALRRELGFAPRTAAPRAETYGWSRRRLLVASRHFSELAPPLAATFVQTGFVFHSRPEDFAPGLALARFMQAGPPPVVLTLSSLVVQNAREFLVMHLRAARAAGYRLLVLGGWSEFAAADLPRELEADDVLFEQHVPHEWLLPKATAVVTHGGIGTLARALQAGCPLVIEPFSSEQVFNAGCVKSLGVGVALHPHRVSVDTLAYALRERITADSVRRNAAALSRKLAAEDGLRNTADAVESALSVEANAA